MSQSEAEALCWYVVHIEPGNMHIQTDNVQSTLQRLPADMVFTVSWKAVGGGSYSRPQKIWFRSSPNSRVSSPNVDSTTSQSPHYGLHLANVPGDLGVATIQNVFQFAECTFTTIHVPSPRHGGPRFSLTARFKTEQDMRKSCKLTCSNWWEPTTVEPESKDPLWHFWDGIKRGWNSGRTEQQQPMEQDDVESQDSLWHFWDAFKQGWNSGITEQQQKPMEPEDVVAAGQPSWLMRMCKCRSRKKQKSE